MRNGSVPTLSVLTILLLFVLFFVFLSIDVMARVWAWRTRFEEPLDVVFLLYMESMRVLVSLGGIAIAMIAMRRRTQAAVPFAFGVALLTVAYTKLIAFDGFPGVLQERLALWLTAQGASRALLAIIFAHAEWSVWLALAGFVLFAARYPRRITAEDVVRSGARDRSGAMRSVALAGVDVGAVARRVTVHALERDWLRSRVVWPVAGLLAFAHVCLLRVTGAPLPVHGTAVALGIVPVAMLVVLVRAGHFVASEAELAPILWLRRGVAGGAALFAAAAVLTQLMPGQPVGPLMLSIAPAAIALCWIPAALAFGGRRVADAGEAAVRV